MQVNWIDDHRFEIGAYRFTIDVTPGARRRLSTDNDFTLVKTPHFLAMYDSLEPRLTGKKILELGLFEGGSLVFFDQRFQPEKIVGIDIRKEPIAPLERYVAGRGGVVETHYATSQDDEAALAKICREAFGGEIDVVVDDASHLYEQTKKSFDVLFRRLAPGGVYIIEDWAWSYQKPYQEASHPWFKKTGMATLLFELIGDLATNRAIDSITIDKTMAVITKSQATATELTYGRGRLRNRASPSV